MDTPAPASDNITPFPAPASQAAPTLSPPSRLDGLSASASDLVTGSASSLSDAKMPSDAGRMALTVTPALPVITLGSQNLNVTTGTALSATFSVQALAGSVVWSATGLPSGCFINPTTGALGGAPQVAGIYNATISATNITGTGTFAASIVVSGGAGVAPVFQFLANDPALTSLLVDIRTGEIVFSRTTPYKQGEFVRLAMIFMDTQAPVYPPDPATVAIAFRLNQQYGAEELVKLPDWTIVAAAGDDPSYLRAEFIASSDRLNREIQNAIDTATAELPTLNLMADVSWQEDGNQRFSQTFNASIVPAVTY